MKRSPTTALLIASCLAALGAAGCGSDAAIDEADAASGDAPTVFAANVVTNELVLDANFIYVLNPAGHASTSLTRLSKADATEQSLAGGIGFATRLRSDGDLLYFGQTSRAGPTVQSIARSGAGRQDVPGARELTAVGGGRVLWTETESGTLKDPLPATMELYSVATSGGAPTVLAAEDGAGESVVADASAAYYERSKQLRRIDFGATESALVADLSSFTPSYLATLVQDDGFLYAGVGDGSIIKVAKAGDEPTVLATVSQNALGLTHDTTHIYFTDVAAGSVQRVSKAGGPVETLATDLARPVAIAVDDTDIYWVDIVDRVIMTLPK